MSTFETAWDRVRTALAARSMLSGDTEREIAQHADHGLGTDLVGRFVRDYYLPGRFGGVPGLTDGAEELVAAIEALPKPAAGSQKPGGLPFHATSPPLEERQAPQYEIREAVAYGLEELREQERREARLAIAQTANAKLAREAERRALAEKEAAAQAAQEELAREPARRALAEREAAAQAAREEFAREAKERALAKENAEVLAAHDEIARQTPEAEERAAKEAAARTARDNPARILGPGKSSKMGKETRKPRNKFLSDSLWLAFAILIGTYFIGGGVNILFVWLGLFEDKISLKAIPIWERLLAVFIVPTLTVGVISNSISYSKQYRIHPFLTTILHLLTIIFSIMFFFVIR